MNDESAEPVGPLFITVVSVDGGLKCGNKLTVITPTEIGDVGKKRNNSAAINNNQREPAETTPQSTNSLKQGNFCHKGKVSAIPTLVGVDRKPNNGISSDVSSPNNNVTGGAAYVTFVSLAEQQQAEESAKAAGIKSGIPVMSYKNHINTKSIVQLGNNPHNEPPPGRSTSRLDCEEDQIITISNKVKGGNHVRNSSNSSFIEISSKEDDKNGNVNWQRDEDIEIPTMVTEQVTILRLPGEKLGFGLRFEGGVANPLDKVRHLFIQSCAFDSPSIFAKTSWGQLGEGDEIIEIESIKVVSMTRMECIHSLKEASVAVRLLIRHVYTGDELSLLRAQREIALQKLKVASTLTAGKKKHPNQNKAQGEILLEIKNGSELKENKKDDAINNKANDSCKSHHVHGLNQQITSSRETISLTSSSTVNSFCSSKIPVPKSKQLNESCCGNNSNNLDNGNNNAVSHEEQSENSIVYDHNESEIEQGQEIDHDVVGEEVTQQLMRLKPPTGFTDELLPQTSHYQSPISLEGCKMAKNVQSSLHSNKNFNLHHQQPIEAQFYHNAISPTHSHRNSSMSLESFGSDETGSSRSTVVSRLSMNSSITSMSAISGGTSDNIMTSSPTTNGNGYIGGGGGNGHNHVLLAKRKSSLGSLNTCPEGVALVVDGETNFEEKSCQNVFTAYSDSTETEIDAVGHYDATLSHSEKEIPLAPPLFFQDRRVVAAYHHRQQRYTQYQSPYELGESTCFNFNSQERGEEIIANANSYSGGGVGYKIPYQHESQTGQTPLVGAQQYAFGNGVSDANAKLPSTDAKVVSSTLAKEVGLTEYTFTSGKNKSKDKGSANAGNENSSDMNMSTSTGEAVATNWEQKGILDYDDDDDLALLAEELGGLDQEDEDLFNSLVAEIDEISAHRSVVNNQNDGKRSDVDELIHQQKFNGVGLTEREIRNLQYESQHFHQYNQQQMDQLCPTFNPVCYKQGDEIRDAKSSTQKHNESIQKATTGCHTKGSVVRDGSKEANEPNGIPSKNKDSIESNFESSDNGDLLTSNKDRLFPPFSKVVEPINSQMMMTIKKKSIVEEQIQLHEERRRKEVRFEKDDITITVAELDDVSNPQVMNVRAPAPPPRTKGLEKRAKENQKIDINSCSTPPKPTVRKHISSDRGGPTSATIVQIDEWKQPEGASINFNSIKLEVRRHNSLTLVGSETSGINSESRTAAASAFRKGRERDDDNGDRNVDVDESKRIDDSSHKDGNLVVSHSPAATAQQGVPPSDRAEEDITLQPERMDNSTEVLHHHHHQFPPPTFSRLPPDGDEFPNNCWSDEKLQQGGKKFYRSEFSIDSSKSSSEPGSPPPLPTSEPPKEDYLAELPPLPDTVPPIPPKIMATRRCSFDDRKKLFESQVSSAKEINNMNGGSFTIPAKPNDKEPSKKSVKDKIAMFSSRSSSEDSGDASPSIFPKQISNHSSSLSKSTVNISNGFNKSSENLLGGTGRKGSVDLSLAPSPPVYATLTRSTPNNAAAKAPSLYERSQSMIDVGGVGENGAKNYQKPVSQKEAHSKFNNTTLARPEVVMSNMIEERRKGMTKLRGLVIPDGPADTTNNGIGHINKTSASVADLPTIISKDAIILPQQTIYNVKPALYPTDTDNSQFKKSLARTESLDRFSITNHEMTNSQLNMNRSNNTLQSAKTNSDLQTSFPNILPKYSPAFKRRGFSAYQSSISASILPSKITPTNTNTTSKHRPGTTSEPKSFESLTSPRSDSSFEFSSLTQKQQRQENEKIFEKPVEVKIDKEPVKEINLKMTNGKSGKLEDSDNDSAVSSSRSSISHGLSPPNSPTPGESTTATPDPDIGSDEKRDQEESMNMDESWRILKPTSIEAINRKNVLKSAKFSSGGGTENGGNGSGGGGGDDSSLSSNGKNRRSDDEDASYADVETEDTESSCSELEGSGNPRRMIVAGRVTLGHGRRDSSKADTEDDDDEVPQQSAVNMEFTELTESPEMAIYDMEVKMAYINEVCDALNDRGRSELSSRYFSRRDSEATVIERPIEPKRKMSIDTTDSTAAADRRARNRSSSGNESDFSSNVSVGSQQNSHKPLSRETSSNNGTDSERWSILEKKYSRSMTSVNIIGTKSEPQTSPQSQPQGLTPATSVPKIVTSASEVVEKKIEKIIEKSNTDGLLKKTNPTIPRGRNDFKSIAEKWQQIEKSTELPASIATKPLIPDKPALSPQSSSGSFSISSTPRSLSSQLTSPPPTTSSSSSPSPTKSLGNILDSKSPSGDSPTPTVSKTHVSSTRESAKHLEAMEADRAWAEKRRSDGEPTRGSGGGPKRSVSVNDIRKAFEKAEIAVNSYEREESSPTQGIDKNKDGSLTLPTAHFRVSSFDSTTSEESSTATPAGLYGSSNSLVSSAPRDPYGSITSLASSTSLISPQELQQLIDEANQSLEEAGTPSHEVCVVILHTNERTEEIKFKSPDTPMIIVTQSPAQYVGSLGITLAGGADYETKEITVHKVLTSSIAERDGRIHRFDRILSINGKSTKGLTHREALNLLKSPRTEVVLVISRGRTVAANGFQTIEETSALDRAIEPLLNGNLVIENDDDTCYKWGPMRTATLVKDGAGLGFSLEGGKGSVLGDKPLTVKKIFIGGPAEKSGELKVGDLIVSINAINMSSKSRTEAWNFMKKLNDGDVKISIRSPLV